MIIVGKSIILGRREELSQKVNTIKLEKEKKVLWGKELPKIKKAIVTLTEYNNQYFIKGEQDRKAYSYLKQMGVPIKWRYEVKKYNNYIPKQHMPVSFDIEDKYIPGTEKNIEYRKSLRSEESISELEESENLLIWRLEKIGLGLRKESELAEDFEEYSPFENEINEKFGNFGDSIISKKFEVSKYVEKWRDAWFENNKKEKKC